jgi:thymidylate synthase
VDTQLARKPFPLPKLVLHRKADSLFDYRFEDIEFIGYQSHPAIKAPVAV